VALKIRVFGASEIPRRLEPVLRVLLSSAYREIVGPFEFRVINYRQTHACSRKIRMMDSGSIASHRSVNRRFNGEISHREKKLQVSAINRTRINPVAREDRMIPCVISATVNPTAKMQLWKSGRIRSVVAIIGRVCVIRARGRQTRRRHTLTISTGWTAVAAAIDINPLIV